MREGEREGGGRGRVTERESGNHLESMQLTCIQDPLGKNGPVLGQHVLVLVSDDLGAVLSVEAHFGTHGLRVLDQNHGCSHEGSLEDHRRGEHTGITSRLI